MIRRLIPMIFVGGLMACGGYRPARFASTPVVTHARDDAPIAIPAQSDFDELGYVAEVYMQRPVLDSLDASRIPDALDVNALDEVVASSWFSSILCDGKVPAGYEVDGLPTPPFRALSDAPRSGRSGLRIVDSRGRQYELRVDAADRLGLITSAEVVSSRLAWCLGYRVPEAHIATISGRDFSEEGRSAAVAFLRSSGSVGTRGTRVVAVRWPMGIHLGPTDAVEVRGDDPNDKIAHRDRRSLRAMKVVAEWLAMKEVSPRNTIDSYVGRSGSGHVQHWMVGWDDSLAAGQVTAEPKPGGPREDMGPDPLMNFVSLGFAPDPSPTPAQRRWKSVGPLDRDYRAGSYQSGTPWAPLQRTLDADGYWMSKRMLRLSDAAIEWAVKAAAVPDQGAGDWIAWVLKGRRRKTGTWWMSRVTPLEVESMGGRELVLRDLMIEQGLETAARTQYEIRFFDGAGDRVGPSYRMQSWAGRWRLTLPGWMDAGQYAVAQVVVFRGGVRAPRAFEAHMASGRLVGVVH